jgi:four helix bundle protein
MNAKKFEDLIVWQKAHKFVLAIYRFTDRFPRSELFALTSQVRRAVVSIPANIAEGFLLLASNFEIRTSSSCLSTLSQTQLGLCSAYRRTGKFQVPREARAKTEYSE